MAKLKLKTFSGKIDCPQGETYKFKKGKAVVPGILFHGQPMVITIKEFRDIINNPE